MMRAGSAILLLLALAALPANGGQYAFAWPEHIRGGEAGNIGVTDAVVVADLDGDGRDDIAALTGMAFSPDGTPQNITLVHQQPDGSLATPEFVAAPQRLSHHLHAADLDGSGGRELLLGHSHGLTVYDLDAAALTAITHYASPVACVFIESADIDRDGRLDVYCQGVDGYATVFRGDGNGRLAGPETMQVPGFVGSQDQARLADVTADGWPDLLLADAASNALFVLPGDRNGGFEPAIAYTYGDEDYAWSPTVEVADIDGDDVVEVLVARKCNNPCAAIQVMRQRANGYLEMAEELPSMDLPTAIIAKDIDGNGRLDLLTAHSGWSSIGRYMGREDGLGAMPAFSYAPTGHGPRRYAVGDIDHDGQVDIVVATSFGITLLHGGRKQASDFDGDLVSDVVWRHTNGRNAIWLSGDVRTPKAMPAASIAWVPQALGDMDGTAGTELFWRNSSNGRNATWAADQDEAQSVLGVSSQDWQVVGAGDFDGDGLSDLLWRNRRTGSNTIWLSGNPARQMAVARVSDTRWTIVGVGDFDADGLSDIFWRHQSMGRNVIWHGAAHSRDIALPAVSLDWKVAGVGDFDRDGEDDVAWRNAHNGRNAIWRSADYHASMTVMAVTNTNWEIAAVGDYDGDGRSDLLWRDRTNGRNTIWLGADHRRQQPVQAVPDRGWRIVP